MGNLETGSRAVEKQSGDGVFGAARALAFAASLSMPVISGGCSLLSGPEEDVQAQVVEQERRAARVLSDSQVEDVIVQSNLLLRGKIVSLRPDDIENVSEQASLQDVLRAVDPQFLESVGYMQELIRLREEGHFGIKHEMELMYNYADMVERVDLDYRHSILDEDGQRELLEISQLLMTEIEQEFTERESLQDRDLKEDLQRYQQEIERLTELPFDRREEAALMKIYSWAWVNAVMHTEAAYFEGYDLIAEAFPE